MHILFLIPLLSLAAPSLALSDIYQQCMEENNEPLDNDLLIGTWYLMYRFTLFGGVVPLSQCPEQVFSRPTAEEVANYREEYDDPTLPYSFDDNPVNRNYTGWQEGMITGNTQAKFFVMRPGYGMTIVGGYSLYAYRFMGEDYVMWQDCNMRGSTLELHSRNRHAPLEEMEEIIKNTPELARLGRQRYCATY